MTDHLALAREYIAKGEDFYRRAADEIAAAMGEDPTLSYRRIAEVVGRSERWVGTLVQWRTNRQELPTPWAGDSERKHETATRKVLTEADPETVERIIAELSPERRDVIVDAALVASSVQRPIPPREVKPTDHGWYPSKLMDESVFQVYRAWCKMQDEVPPTDEIREHCVTLAGKLGRYAEAIERLLVAGEVDEELRELGEVEP